MANRKVAVPSYQRIAADIAQDIVQGKYTVGQRLSGRTNLSGLYSVSPETIRKAVSVLQDMSIVRATKGSGVEVLSVENARAFSEQYGKARTLDDIKREIAQTARHQQAYLVEMMQSIERLMSLTERYDTINQFLPFKILLTSEALHLGQNLSELNFWHATGATVIAIARKERMILSPGPYATLEAEDILYFVGEQACFERVHSFFKC